MKKLLAITFMVFGTVFGAFATGNNVTVVAEKRANHLSEQMIRELRLNNYQANKVREINLDVAAQITEIEQKHAGNEQLIAEKCKDVLAVRDLEFEDILSTVQYNDYFGDRKMYSKVDREFVSTLSEQDSQNMATNEKADKNVIASNAN
ncbi:hypothetical protein [Pontibacter amylolyticus]|uniref:Uncharacterized protein n=1 Tax=Pontibacter amylolyticus TaxID=1424080 RepID=A0ABQ1WDG0_9BACT|nr:hypothetical protein [Pontibacter amylolyticus]GGG27401.1 hypothetical protein GCM10011323_33660 [Pontibacter amylolyticus]